MAKKFIIDIFKPPGFKLAELDLDYLNTITGKKFIYASKGRFALYHILKSLDIKDKILLPAYICPSVLEPIRKLKISPIFYDLEIEDLNASFESISFLSQKYNVKAVLVASMYGNPANLSEIENFCKEKEIILIDDAAQSFGAKLANRFIGTFGNAGFISFSPGKSTTGHMGSFFWTNNTEYNFAQTKHQPFHYLSYLDFYFNRYQIYKYKKFKIFKILSIFKKISERIFDITNDDISPFEDKILGGILNAVLREEFGFRKEYFLNFTDEFKNNNFFRIIKSLRGEPHNHKFVILFNERATAENFIKHLFKNKIYCLRGYKLLTDDLAYLPNSQKIDGKVVEIPIENDEYKMDYLFKTVKNFKS